MPENKACPDELSVPDPVAEPDHVTEELGTPPEIVIVTGVLAGTDVGLAVSFQAALAGITTEEL